MRISQTPVLERFGLSEELSAAYSPQLPEGTALGRIIAQHRGEYEVVSETGVRRAPALPELIKDARKRAIPVPVVGDWVALGRMAVCALLPRTSVLSRKAAGKDDAQQVAANVDTAFVISGLVGDFSPRRVERFLSMVREGGVAPVLVFTKVDLIAEDEKKRMAEILLPVAGNTPVLWVSALTGEGIDALEQRATRGTTVALLGSSGVGKSTLLNRLLGEERQATQTVRDNGRGRHTTVQRELVPLPSGAVLLDNPGIRELGLWDADDGVGEAFPEVEAVARDCRFRDCRHGQDAGCAVRQAVAQGVLLVDRVNSYLKLNRELAELRTRIELGRPSQGRASSGRPSSGQTDDRTVIRSSKSRMKSKRG